MEVKLVVVAGATPQASEFALRLPTVVGRSRTADLPLANPLVSRKHCEIFEADGQLMVRDLGSLNGTFIGKTRIEETSAMPPGSLLTIGAITFRAEYAGTNGAAKPAAAAPAKAAAQIDSDVATVDVDDLDPLEPLAEAAGGDSDFSLSWLEEDSSSPLTDSIGANGTPAAETAAMKKTVATKETAAQKSPATKKDAAAKGKPAAAPQGKAAPAADSDSLGDLDDLCT
ncbi:MAG TPA: FHA domain-containing protein [Pirellulales bacterium]|jgi:pSer/pThr/pTyr-binding forkhead associated (FHA) protein|nr:FHA domain-containing protein [Pirellulales bacterium]